jgi:DNA polymerase
MALFNLRPMSAKTAPDILVDTIHYLEQQKARGVRYLRVAPELMEDLSNLSSQFARGLPIVDARNLPSADAPAKALLSSKESMTPTEKAEFEELRKQTLACKKCAHLVKSRKQVVFGVGNPDTELMFVGEAPGADEDKQGEPFVGRAGQLLTKMIQAMGLQRSDVYIANILKCRPDVDTPTGNRKPTPEEMAICIPHLEEQIRLIRPKVLVALGDTAVKGLVPSLKEGITRLRGHWLEYRGIPLMPTFHPSYLLRNASAATKRLCWEDLLAVLEKLEKPISKKQRSFFLSAVSGQQA